MPRKKTVDKLIDKPSEIREDFTIWTPILFDKKMQSNFERKQERVLQTGSKDYPRKKESSWVTDLIQFFIIAAELVLSLWKGEMASPEKMAQFLTDMWMRYCNIRIIPDIIERKIIKALARALVGALIALLKTKLLTVGSKIKAGKIED